MDASNPAHQALPKTPTSAPNQSFDWSNEQQMALAFERFVQMNPHLLHQQSKVPLPTATFNHFPHLYDEVMEAKTRQASAHFNKPFHPDEFKQLVSFDNIACPELKKPDLSEMKSFWKKYVRYRKELDEKYKMFGGSVAIQFKNVRQCMDEYTFESLCLYRWNRDPDDVSDEDVNCLFEADCLGSKVDIKIFLDKLEKDLKMDKSVTDGPSRVLCLVRLFDKICTESGFPKYYEIEVEAARRYFLNALEPISVRKKISTELRFSKKRYMFWKDFVDLCIEFMKTWCMYEDVFKSDTRPEAKPEARKKFDRPNQKPRVEKKQAESADTAAPGDAKAKASNPSYTCLKCQSVEMS
ncbi:unnamed protein product [Aphanomyces euteiches]